MGKRRICVFCETWASGGIESFLSGVLLRQDPEETELDLAAAAVEDSVYTGPLRDRGVRFISLSGSRRRFLENGRRFRRLLAQRRYDAVYVNAYNALGLRYGLLARRAGVPVRVLHSHCSDIRPHILRPLKLLVHRIARSLYCGAGTEYFACSDEAAAFLFLPRLKKGGTVRFLPNGIDTLRFRFRAEERVRVRRELGLEDCFLLGHLGRMSGEKNQAFLLEVLAALLPLRPDARLILAGDGVTRPDLEKRAAELGIREKVIFAGLTDKPQELLWAMDLFLFPSLMEGLGIAAVEAQCAGLPLLCSEHIPARTMITGLAKRMPLAEGPEAWAKAAASAALPEDREGYADAVRRAGFDVREVSRTLRDALIAPGTPDGKGNRA